VCRTLRLEVVGATSPFAGLNDFSPVSAAADANGDVTVMLKTARRFSINAQYAVEGGPWLLSVSRGGSWTSTVMTSCSSPADSAPVARVGPLSAALIGLSQWRTGTSASPCAEEDYGFEAVVVGPQGETFNRVQLPNVRPYFGPAASLAVSPAGNMEAALTAEDETLWTASRDPAGTWSVLQVPGVAASRGYTHLLYLDATPVILDMVAFTDEQVGIRAVVARDSKVEVSEAMFPDDCASVSELAFTAVALSGAPHAMAVFTCDTDEGVSPFHGPGVAVFDLRAHEAERWSAPAFVEPTGGVASHLARYSAPAPLPDGTPGIAFVDYYDNVRLATQNPLGWDSVVILGFGEGEGGTQHAGPVFSFSTSHETHILWRQFTEDDPTVATSPQFFSAVAHAVISP
jgi:hypothetical protein